LSNLRPRIQYMPRVNLDPSRVYNRPALPPVVVSAGGAVGANRYNLNKQFEYTLRQMAVSPFSVNSQAYMQRIRDEYGYVDSGAYEALGLVGGVVGAGTGFLLGSGFNFKQALGSTIDMNALNDAAKKRPWFNPKRIRGSEAFRTSGAIKDIKAYNRVVDTIEENRSLIKSLTASRAEKLKELTKAQEAYSIYKKRGRPAKATLDHRNTLRKGLKTAEEAVDNIDNQIKSAKGIIKTAASQADDAAFALAKTHGVAVKAGKRVSLKFAGMVPYAGMAADIASFGLSATGLAQSIEEGDALNIALNTVALVGDTAAVIGDVISLGGVTMPIGEVISNVGGLVSAGVSAIQGFLFGQTVGRSLSPEGAKAQALFTQNLYAGMAQRPAGTVATALTMFGTPMVLGALSRYRLGPVSGISRWMTTTALGNQVRAGVSMMATQAITPLTNSIDERLPWAPQNPEDVSFVSAISLMGDLNDNLYGATRMKSILVGAVAGDASEMTKAMARSWGHSDEMYKSVTFDDVRETAGLDLSPIGNSIFSVIGEMLIDPQNWYEAGVRMQRDRTVEAFTATIMKTLDYEHARVKMTGGVADLNGIGKLVEDSGILARGKRLSDADRTRLVKDVVTSYMEKGAKGVRDTLMKHSVSYFKGTDSRVRKSNRADLKTQQDAMLKLLDGMADGSFRYNVKNPDDTARAQENYKKLQSLQRKVKQGKDISEENQKLLNDITGAYENLKSVHGNDLNDARLLEEFINRADIVLSPRTLQTMYMKFNEMRYHMDLSDAFSRAVTTVSNPAMTLVKGVSFSLQKYNAYVSRFKMNNKQKAVKILSKKELLDNLSKVVDESEVEATRAKHDPQMETFEGLLAREKTDEDALVDDVAQETVRRTDEINQRREAEKSANAEVKKDIEEKRNALAELHKGNVYNSGRNYINARTKNTVYIDDQNAKSIEEEVKNYGKEDSGKEPTHDELQAKLNKDKRSRDTQVRERSLNIQDKYEALLDYTYAKSDLKLMDAIFAKYRTVVTLADLGSAELHDHLIKLLTAHNIYRRYITAFEQVPVAMILKEALDKEESLRNHDKNVMETLQKEKRKITASKAADKEKKLEANKKQILSLSGAIAGRTKRINEYTESLKKENERVDAGNKPNLAKRAVYLGEAYDALFNERNIDETLSTLDKMLPYFGLLVSGLDENGNKVTINLKTFHKKHLEKNAPLQLEYKPSIESGVLSIIKRTLGITDMDMLSKGVLDFEIDFKEKWDRYDDRYDKKYALLREFIASLDLNLSPEQRMILLEPGNMRALMIEIDNAVKFSNEKEYVQLQALSDDRLHEIVFSQMTNLKSSHLSKVMSQIKKVFAEINVDLNKALKSDEFKEMPYFWDALYRRQLGSYNEILKTNVTYRYLEASLYSHTKTNAFKTGLFVEREAMNDLLPDFLSKKQIKDIKDGKGYYSLERFIKDHSENPIIQQAKESVKKDWEHIKASNKPLDEATDNEIIGNAIDRTLKAKSQEIKKRTKERAETRERKQVHTDRMDEAFEKLGLDEITEDMYNVLRLSSSLSTKAFFELDYIKSIAKDFKGKYGSNELTRKLIIAVFMNRFLDDKVKSMDLGSIVYDFKPTSYRSSDPKDKSKKTYYQLLKEHRRTSPGHEQRVMNIAKQLVYMESKYDYIRIGKKNLVDLKRMKHETDEAFLVRRIVETYKNTDAKHFVRVYSDTSKNTSVRSAKAFKNAIKEAAHVWMIEHTSNDRVYGYDIIDDEAFAMKDVKSFLDLLAKESTEESTEIKNEIFKIATEIFDESLKKNHYDIMHNAMQRMGESLTIYEQTDKDALGERNYITPYDVVKKQMFSDTEFMNTVKDLVKMRSGRKGTKYESGIMSLLNRLGIYMNEDYQNKKDIRIQDFLRIESYKGETKFIMKGRKETDPETSIGIFQLLYTYHVTYSDFIALLNHVTKETSTTFDESVNMRIDAIQEYEQLVKEAGPLFSYLKTDVKKLGIDGFEHEELDFDYGRMYQKLRMKHILSRDIQESKDKKHPRSKNYKYTPDYFNEHMEKVYKKAMKNGLTPENLLVALLDAPKSFPIDLKKKILQRVFFMNFHIGRGEASQTNIDALQKTIDDNKVKLKGLDETTREYTRLSNKIKVDETRIKNLIYIKNRYKYSDLEVRTDKDKLDAEATFENFYRKVILADRKLTLAIFNNTIDTDADDLISADTKSPGSREALYTLIKRKNADGGNNFDTYRPDGVRKGTGMGEALNRILGEDVIRANDKDILEAVKKAALNSERWSEFLGDANIAAASDKGIIVVLPEGTSASKAYDLYKKRFILRSYLEDETFPDIFIVTKEQHDTLKSMKTAKDYRESNYAKHDDKGNVIGETLNIINTSANRERSAFDQQINMVESYMSDLKMLMDYAQASKKKLEKVADELVRYMEKVENVPELKQVYFGSEGFTASKIFKRMVRHAETHEAFSRFLELVDPTGAFTDFNMDMLGRVFFNDTYIKKGADGNHFDLNTLEKNLKTTDYETYVLLTETIRIAGKPMYARIKSALLKMQKEYGDSDISFNYNSIMNKDFLDDIIDVSKSAYAILTRLKTHHRKVYDRLMPEMRRELRTSVIRHTRFDELSERDKFLNTHSDGLYDKQGKYIKQLLNPYGGSVDYSDKDNLQRQAVRALKNVLNGTDDSGYYNEARIAESLREQRARQKARTAAINESRKGKKINNINLKNFHALLRDVNNSEKSSINKGAHGFKLYKLENDGKLKRLSELLYERIASVKKGDKNVPNLKNISKWLEEVEAAEHVVFDSAEKVYNYIIYKSLSHYVHNIENVFVTGKDEKGIAITAAVNLLRRGEDTSSESIQREMRSVEEQFKKEFKMMDKTAREEYRKNYNDKEKNISESNLLAYFLDEKSKTDLTVEIEKVLNGAEDLVFHTAVAQPKPKQEQEKAPEYKTVKEYMDKEVPEEERELFEAFKMIVVEHKKREGILRLLPDIIKAEEKGETVSTKSLPHFFDTVYSILKKSKDVKTGKKHLFKDAKEVFVYTNLNILDDNKEFLTTLRKFLFRTDTMVFENVPAYVKEFLSMFGIKERQQYNLFFTDRYNLKQKMDILAETLSKQEMYALTIFLNMRKKIFLKDYYGRKFGWQQAHNDFVIKPIKRAMETVESVEATGVFDRRSVWENSVIERVNRASNNIRHIQKGVAENNRKLSAIYIPYDSPAKEVHDMRAEYLTTRDSNMLNIARKHTREVYSGVFNDETGYAPIAEEKMVYKKLLADVVLDSIAEEFAPDVNQVGSTSTTYQDLRERFTEILNALQHKTKANDFIKMREIGYAFNLIRNDREAVYMWKREFNKYNKRLVDTEEVTALNAAVQKTVDYFSAHSYLVNGVTPDTIQAIMGRILYDRGLIKQSTVERSAKEIHERAIAHVELKKEKLQTALNSVAHSLNPNRDINDISKVIYDMTYDEIDDEIHKLENILAQRPGENLHEEKEKLALLEQKQRTLRHVLALHRAINHKVTAKMYTRVHDTYDFAYLSQKPELFKETNAGRMYANMFTKIQSLEEEQRAIEKSNSGFLGAHGSYNDARVKYDDLRNTTLVEALEKIEEAEEALKLLNEEDDYFKENTIKRIILKNPKLLEEYVLYEVTKYEKKNDALVEARASRTDGIKEEIVKEYYHRKERLEIISKFFQGSNYKAWRSITPAQVAQLSPEQKDIYDRLTETVRVLREEQKEYRKPPRIFDSEGKALFWKSAFKTLKKRDDHIRGLEQDLLDMEINRVKTVDDVDDNTKIRIVKNFFKDIIKEYNKETSFKKFFKEKGDIKRLSKVSRETLRKILERASEKTRNNLIKFFEKAYADETVKTKPLDKDVFEALIKVLMRTDKTVSEDARNFLKQTILTSEEETLSGKADPELKLLRSRFDKFVDRLQENAEFLTAIANMKNMSYKDVLFETAKEYFKTDEEEKITEENLLEIVEYLSGERNEIRKEQRTDLKKQLDDARTLRDKTNVKIAALEKYLFENPRRTEELMYEIETLKANASEVRDRHDKYFDKNINYHKNGLSNIGVFKTLYEIESDEGVLEKVLELSNHDYSGHRSLKRVIKDASDGTTDGLELHNPVVDVLISRLNYMKQHEGNIKDTYLVFDMETLKDEMGNDVPYQMTLLTQKGSKFSIRTMYFSGPVFYDYLNDGDIGPTLIKFYEQQRQILAKQFDKDLSKQEDIEWMDARTDALVKKVKKWPNDIAFVELFLRELSADNDIPIVVHNGNKFDLPNFDIFVKNISKRLLTNLYYQEIKSISPTTIRERFGNSSAGALVDRGLSYDLIEKYQLEISNIQEKIRSGKPITSAEIDRLDEFQEALWTTEALQVIKDVEREKGLIIDNETKEALFSGQDSEAMKLKQQIYNYIKSKDVRTRRQIEVDITEYFLEGFSIDHDTTSKDKEDIKVFVKDMLKNVVKRYAELRKAEKLYDEFDSADPEADRKQTRAVRIMQRIREARNTVQTGSENAYEKNTNSLRELLETHEEMISEIKGIASWVRKNGSDVKGTIDKLQQEIRETDDARKLVDDEIKKAQRSVNRLNVSERKALKELTETVQRIHDTTKNPKYLAYRTLSKKLPHMIKAQADIFRNSNTGALLRLEIVEQQRNLDELYRPLMQLLTYAKDAINSDDIDAVREKLESFIVSDELLKAMLEVKDEDGRKALNAEIEKRITKLEKYKKAQEEGTEIVLDTYIKDTLVKMKRNAQKEVQEAYKALESLWNGRKTKTLFGVVDGADINLEKDGALYKHIEYEKLLDVLKKYSGKREDEHFQNILKTIVGIQKYVKDVDLSNTIKVDDLESSFLSGKFKELLLRTIEYDLNVLNGHKTLLGSLDINKKDDLEKTATVLINKYLTVVRNAKDIESVLENRTLFNIMHGERRPLEDMSEKELAIEARQVEDSAYIRALHEKDPTNKVIKRVYKDLLRFEDKYAWSLKNYDNKEGDFYITERGDILQVSIYDSYNDTVQSFSFNKTSSKHVTFDLTYTYREIGKEILIKKKTMSLNTRFNDLDEFLKTFFSDRKGATKGLSPMDVYVEDGVDRSYESIKHLIKLYSTYRNTEAQTMKVSDIKKKGTLDTELNISKLEFVNMSKQMENKFQEELLLLQWAKRGSSFKDINRVHAGIANKVLSKFKSLVPGKVLNMIHEDFSRNFVILYDETKDLEVLKKNKIDLLNSSEGSAGSSFMRVNPYTTVPLFKHTTNPIRTVLSNTKQYVKYSANKILNDLYMKQDTVYRDNLTEYIAMDEYKVRDKERFIQYDENRNVIEIFTPNVVTEDGFNKYKNDILHRVGINMTVGFFNDSRTIEDTILMDAEDAIIYGWNQSDKTWLSAYGFKGAVRFVPGLRKTYGVSVLANAGSVYERRAFGAIHEMSLNNLRKYLLKETNPEMKLDIEFNEALKKVIEEKKEQIKKLLPIKEGKIVVDPNTDYGKLLEELFDTETTHWTDLHRAEVVDTSPIKEQLTDGSIMEYTIDPSAKMYRGELYVMLDSEHVASHMQTKAEVSSLGGITTVMRNPSNNVRGGVVISPSVVYTMMAKGDIDWTAAFPKDNRKLEIYMDIHMYGIEELIRRYETDENGNKRTVKETFMAVDRQLSSTLSSSVLEYFRLKEMTKDSEMASYAKLRLDRLDINVKQKALENLVDRKGAYYSSMFRKHEGVRQQVVANSTLLPGEIRSSREAFKALLDITETWSEDNVKGSWLSLEDVKNDEVWKMITDLESDQMKKTLDKNELREYIKRLNSFGIINIVSDFKKTDYKLSDGEIAQDLYKIEIKNKTATIEFFKRQQYSGRVLGVRSPVQDYNAVPMLKIIGFSDHSGAEANPWLYRMTGGDNDGDTYGFAAIGFEQRKHLKGLDATDPGYYDEGYIDKNRPKKKFTEGVRFGHTSVENAYVGKKTFVEVYFDNMNKRQEVRIRDSYLISELHNIAYKQAFTKKINEITEKELTNAKKVFETSYALKRIYVNMIIRNLTQGHNIADKNNNPDKVEFTAAYYDLKNNEVVAKREIDKIYNNKKYNELILRHYVYNTKADKISYADALTETILKEQRGSLSLSDQEELKKYTLETILAKETKDEKLKSLKEKMMFNVLYDRMVSNTITRIQISKRGINIFGGNRKKQMVASLLSTYQHLNKNVDGNIWNPLRNKNKEITVESIFQNLLSLTPKGKKAYEELNADLDLFENIATEKIFRTTVKKVVDVEDYNRALEKAKINEHITTEDFDALLDLVYKNYRKYLLAKKELFDLGVVYGKEDPKALIEFLKNSSKKDDTFVKSIIKRLTKDSMWLTTTEIIWLKTLYFGRFQTEADKFFRRSKRYDKLRDYADMYARGYLEQQILDRRAFNKMSDKATEIIAVAKHFGIDANSSEYLRSYTAAVEALTDLAAKRKVFIGEEHDLGMAIAMDMNPFSDVSVKDETLNKRFEELEEDYKHRLKKIRTSSTADGYKKMLEDQLQDNAKVQLLGGAVGVPEKYYKEIETTVETFLKVLNDTKSLDKALENPEFVDSVNKLMSEGIAMYHIERMLTNSYTLYRRINNYYHDKSGGSTLKQLDYAYIRYGTYFFELSRILFSPLERESFKNDYADHPEIVSFMLNIRQQDPNYFEDKKIEDVGDFSDSEKGMEPDDDTRMFIMVSKEGIKERVASMSDRIGMPEAKENFSDSDFYEHRIVNHILNELDMIGSKQPTNLYDVIESYINDMATYSKIKQNKEIKFKETGMTPSKEQQRKIDLINRYVFGFHNIAQYLQDVKKSSKELQVVLDKLTEKEKELKRLVAKTYVLEETLRTLKEKKEYFEIVKNKTELIKTLESLRRRYEERLEKFNMNVLGRAFNEELGSAAVLLHTKNKKTLKQINHNKPKYLDENFVDDLKGNNLMNMEKYQTPFLFLIDLFKKDNGDYNWDELFKWYKKNRRFYRFTVLMDAFDDESLARKLHDVVYKEDEWWNSLSSLEKAKRKNIKKRRNILKNQRFESAEDLKKYMQRLANGETDAEGKAIPKLIHRGERLENIDSKIINSGALDEFISPTLKEIDIRSAKDFKDIYELLKDPEHSKLMIGFSDMDSVMDGIEQSWKPYRLDGMFGDFVLRMQLQMKLFMRASGAFLFRNLVDTWMQLFSHMYVEQGAVGVLKNSKQILRYMGMTMHIDAVYKDVSEESFLMRQDINLDYVRLTKVLDEVYKTREISGEQLLFVKSAIHRINSRLEAYLEGAQKIESNELTNRIKNRIKQAKRIKEEMKSFIEDVDIITSKDITDLSSQDIMNLVVFKERRALKNTVSFMMDTRFAEFFTLFDYLQVDPTKTNGYRKRIERIVSKYKDVEYEDFKHILFEISAFMQTNAQLDVYRQESYKYLTQIINDEKFKDTEDYRPKTYEELLERLNKESVEHKEKFLGYIKDPMEAFLTGHWKTAGKELLNTYNQANSWIESTARIAGYLFDRYLHNKQFDDTVNRSLKRWFNYGQRSPIEMQLLADIPYLSFPIRSIDNWIDRMTNPQYIRVMSDFIDGIYDQYADEDGQYNKYVQFQIQNGWLPIGGSVGLRLGHGGLDVQNILSDFSGFIEQRTSPILRAVKTLIKDQDVISSLKSLAMTGIITRTANTFGPRELMQQTPVVQDFVTDKPRSIGSSTAFTFDHYEFEKYTPYKYRYSKNGRYAYYENLYKDWFNKYGRMRKPSVNPYYLVKNIQWKTYVRQRQYQNMTR